MCMHIVRAVLVFLACIGHGKRVQKARRYDSVQDSSKVSAKLSSLGALLIALKNPVAAWQVSSAHSLAAHGIHSKDLSRKLQRTLKMPRAPSVNAQLVPSDGELNWDEELSKLTRSPNEFYEKIRAYEPTALVTEFASTAPPEVQFAVKATVASFMGRLPEEIATSTVSTIGRNLASLMFNMQLTGYMFRSAEYRKSLSESMSGLKAMTNVEEKPDKLPPVTGEIKVKLGSLEAQVDADAYMSELRSEVETLRNKLKAAKASEESKSETSLMTYIQSLSPVDQQQLTQSITEDVLTSMSMLVKKLLVELNIGGNQQVEAEAEELRDLLISQLVTGYKLHELEVRKKITDQFLGKTSGPKDPPTPPKRPRRDPGIGR